MLIARPPRQAALRPFVEAFWFMRGAGGHGYEGVAPSGRGQLLFRLDGGSLCDFSLDGAPLHRVRGAALQGPTTVARLLDRSQQTAICGASFHPGGIAAILPDASEAADRIVDLGALWRRGSDEVHDALHRSADPHRTLDLLEGHLGRRLRDTPPDPVFHRAVQLLRSGLAVGAVERGLDLPSHVLRALFRARAGMTPKRFARIERFRRILATLGGDTPLAELALETGHADQAHMIREFRTHMGCSPTRYRAVSPRTPTHFHPPSA